MYMNNIIYDLRSYGVMPFSNYVSDIVFGGSKNINKCGDFTLAGDYFRNCICISYKYELSMMLDMSNDGINIKHTNFSVTGVDIV